MQSRNTIGSANTALTVYSGSVIDSVTGEPIPGATVTIFAGATPLHSVAASVNGKFNLSGAADTIVITSASYKDMIWPASPFQHVFELEPNDQTLDTVTLPGSPAKKQNYSWALLLLLIPLLSKKKVSGIGKIDTSTVVTAGVAVVAIMAIGGFKRILEVFGLADSRSTKNLDASSTNPLSPWSPNFWLQGPWNFGIPPLDNTQVGSMLNDLLDAFGLFNDDEAKAIGVFKKLQTQAQLSYFADVFRTVQLQDGTGGDLLQWLRGGTWPDDRLSDSEVDQINQYILGLPKY